MKISSKEIREKYLKFMEKKWHKIIPSSPLIPENDPTTLFTWSGMQPMVPYLLWEAHPLWTKITDSQKSFRTQDIDDIWDNRHTTFFEMLWNWSLWDYFKKEQISWIFEFLTVELKLNPKKIYVTVFRWNDKLGISRDDEAVKFWKEEFKKVWIEALDIDNAEEKWMQWWRIFYYGKDKNWWSRAWIPENMPIWEPGGPDSEMFWDFWSIHKFHENSQWKDKPCHPNCDCGRFLEIWNNVFMQFIKTDSWFKELENKNIDFGWWLERIAVAIQDNPDIFMWDLFEKIRNKIEEISGKKYGENEEETMAFRVVMDHLRAATFLICDWAIPSNKDQWYFTRRLIRRAIRYAKNLWIKWYIFEIAKEVIETYEEHYKELEKNKVFILQEMQAEETQFLKTLDKWLKEFDKLLKDFETTYEKTWKIVDMISWEKVFKLYDTYWFPLELTEELAKEKGLIVDKKWFEFAFKKHKDLSRTASAWMFKWWLSDSSEDTTVLHTVAHIMLAWMRKVLWEEVHQKWSNITAERIRFDFSYPEKVEKEKLKEIEDYVNEVISKNCIMYKEEVRKIDAEKDSSIEWSFWEKYPEIVKVYTLKDKQWNVYSRELCWWPHISNTSWIWTFKIKKEESSSKWVRRIKAVLEKN